MSNDTGTLGRSVTLQIGTLTILGRQTKGITVNNERLDVTDDDSDGWATALRQPGQQSVEIPLSGIVKDINLLRSVLSDSEQVHACTLTYPEGHSVSGNFFLESYSETGEYNTVFTFDVSLSSSGEVLFNEAL